MKIYMNVAVDPERAAYIQRFQTEVIPIFENIYREHHNVWPQTSIIQYQIAKVARSIQTYVCMVTFRYESDNEFELMFQIRTLSKIVKHYAYNMFKKYNFNDNDWKHKVSTDIQTIFPPNSATPSKPVPGDNSYRLMSHDANLWSAIHRLTLIAERYISH